MPKTLEEALKPCPFCGGTVTLEQPIRGYGRGDEWWGVVCRNTINLGGTCAIEQMPSRTKEAAIARWNMRANPSSVAAFDDGVECARLLGSTQAKKGFCCYTEQDSRFERAMYEAIARHRRAMLAAHDKERNDGC